MTNKYTGSDFDAFLAEQSLLERAKAVATKRVIAWQIEREMADQKISKTAMARQMRTSRVALDRLLDPEVASVTLLTLERAARALGMKLAIELRSP